MQISSVDQLENPLPARPDPVLRTFRTTVLLTTGLTAFVGIMYSFLQPEIPLFYTLAQPERQLVHKVWIFFLPALAWLVALGHLLLLKVMRELDEGVRRIFSWTTLGLVLIIGMLLIRVFLLVT